MNKTNACSPYNHLGPISCDGLDHYCNACGSWMETCPDAGLNQVDDRNEETDKLYDNE